MTTKTKKRGKSVMIRFSLEELQIILVNKKPHEKTASYLRELLLTPQQNASLMERIIATARKAAAFQVAAVHPELTYEKALLAFDETVLVEDFHVN